MKRVFLILLLGGFSLIAKADHITGGEMFYTFIEFKNGQYSYAVTLKLFMRCNSGRQFPDPAIISIFDKQNFSRVGQDISTPISNRQIINLTSFDPCISNPPVVCYDVAYYNFTISVPPSSLGYLVSTQVNYRIRGISNLDGSQVGATYTCEIPATPSSSNDQSHNSATFNGSDLVVVCAGNFFSYSFGASDADGNEIRYSFCAAYSSSNGGTNGTPPGAPPYNPVPYNSNYSQTSPLGDQVTINSSTGLITGIAPSVGVYVVTVCAEEMKDGETIAIQRKDLQINIADCSIAAAVLEPDYMLCGNTRAISIGNNSSSPLIVSYDWTVFSPAGSSLFTTTNKTLDYTFATNGTYTVQLIVNRGQQCSDTGSTTVFVYPGLAPDFETSGICISRPTTFTDRTTIVSGSINSWKWDFGEVTTTVDVSTLQNNIYTYPYIGAKDVRLIVTTTDGCRDTVNKIAVIINKPPITLAFRDTLICLNDRLQLQAAGTGNFSWSPAINITNATTAAPVVSPPFTTTYYADLDTDGCRNRDSVKVRVVNFVSLQVMNDTSICRGDTIQLRIISDGLQYRWTPDNQIINSSVKNPFVITTPAVTSYQVTATIGGCSVNGDIRVNTSPYPVADAGRDTIICYNTSAQLHGSTNGNSWQWTPVSTLSDQTILNPVAYPVAANNFYMLTAYDNRSNCGKPGRDTVLVTMLPRIHPFAGRDTAVIIHQPLQFNATGGERYIWSPSFSLSANNIANPVGLFDEPSNGMRYRVDVYNIAGCFDSAFITVKVFGTIPTVFVPTAFTPNNDGKNDVLRPIAVGMKSFDYFQVFNRWGQLVFSTSADGRGWDGRIGGQLQGANTYVWIAKATDFTGKAYFQKGTVTLIR